MNPQFLALTLTSIISLISIQVSATECVFVPRTEAGELLDELPINVLGWAKCAKEKEADHLFVAKTGFTDNAEVEEYASALAMMLDPGSQSFKKTWQSKSSLDERQLMIRTDRGTGKAKTDHFVFLVRSQSGPQYLFIHSAGERETAKLRPTLDRIRDYLKREDFLGSIEADSETKLASKK